MEDKVLFKVEFEVLEQVTYSVYAVDEDEAIEIAQKDANLDHNGRAEYVQSWEV